MDSLIMSAGGIFLLDEEAQGAIDAIGGDEALPFVLRSVPGHAYVGR